MKIGVRVFRTYDTIRDRNFCVVVYERFSCFTLGNYLGCFRGRGISEHKRKSGFAMRALFLLIKVRFPLISNYHTASNVESSLD
jgi:hypothetical protein